MTQWKKPGKKIKRTLEKQPKKYEKNRKTEGKYKQEKQLAIFTCSNFTQEVNDLARKKKEGSKILQYKKGYTKGKGVYIQYKNGILQ